VGRCADVIETTLDCELSIFAAGCKMVGNGQIVLHDAKNNNNMSAPRGKFAHRPTDSHHQ
jgi:hypothetical protein